MIEAVHEVCKEIASTAPERRLILHKSVRPPPHLQFRSYAWSKAEEESRGHGQATGRSRGAPAARLLQKLCHSFHFALCASLFFASRLRSELRQMLASAQKRNDEAGESQKELTSRHAMEARVACACLANTSFLCGTSFD